MRVASSGPSDGVVEVVDQTRPAPMLDVVVPVHNEAHVLERSVRILVARLGAVPHSPHRVTIADNASTDGTWEVATRLANQVPGVRAVRIDRKGRGHALRRCWATSDATVVAYMDVDLSTDLDALSALVSPIIDGRADLAIGSRLVRGARVERGPRREMVSRVYNLLLGSLTRAGFTDAQCGFKAVRATTARRLLPSVANENWFFDTELLLLAEQEGLRIHEVPVRWTDDPDSRVDVVATAVEDLRGLARLTRDLGRRPRAEPDTRLRGQVRAFVTVGAITTAAHLGGFGLLHRRTGALVANALTLGGATVLNTTLNRRHTFGVRDRVRAGRDHLEAGLLYGLGLGVTTASLLANGARRGAPTRRLVIGLAITNASLTLGRFVLLRAWVFHPARRREAQPPPGQSASDRPLMRS